MLHEDEVPTRNDIAEVLTKSSSKDEQLGLLTVYFNEIGLPNDVREKILSDLDSYSEWDTEQLSEPPAPVKELRQL